MMQNNWTTTADCVIPNKWWRERESPTLISMYLQSNWITSTHALTHPNFHTKSRRLKKSALPPLACSMTKWIMIWFFFFFFCLLSLMVVMISCNWWPYDKWLFCSANLFYCGSRYYGPLPWTAVSPIRLLLLNGCVRRNYYGHYPTITKMICEFNLPLPPHYIEYLGIGMHKASRSQEEQEEGEDNIGVWSLGCLFVLVIRLANNIDLCILCVHFDPGMVKNVYNLLLPNLCYSHMVFIGKYICVIPLSIRGLIQFANRIWQSGTRLSF